MSKSLPLEAVKTMLKPVMHLIGKKADREDVPDVSGFIKSVNGATADENGNVDVTGLPEGASAYQQLVTDGEGNTKWEDKPFGECAIKTVLLEKQSLTFDTDSSNVRVGFYPTKAGEVIHVKWDGIEYVCTSFYWNMSMSFAWGNPAAGGSYEASSANEPFLIVDGIIDTNSAGTYTVEIWKEEVDVKIIDPKYLPEHSHNWDQIEDKPEMFSGSWNDLEDRPFGNVVERFAFVENNTQIFDAPGARVSFNGFAQATDKNKEIIVVWDEVEYRCTPYYGGSTFMDYIAGSKTIWTDSNANHEYPFLIVPIGGMYFDIMAATTGEHTFSVYQENVISKTLPEEYIPDTIARTENIPECEIKKTYTLTETITLAEAINSKTLTFTEDADSYQLALSCPAAEAALGLSAEVYTADGLVAYMWMAGMIDTTAKYAKCSMYRAHGEWVFESMQPVNNANQTSAVSRNPKFVSAEKPITKIVVYASGSGMMPAGTTIEVRT